MVNIKQLFVEDLVMKCKDYKNAKNKNKIQPENFCKKKKKTNLKWDKI